MTLPGGGPHCALDLDNLFGLDIFWSPGKLLSITIYANIFVIVLCTAFAVLGLEFLPDWNAPAFTRFK